MKNQIVEIGKGTKQEGSFESKIYKNLDINKFPSLDYRHAFFEDVGGKVDMFENVDFSYCVMTRAYFHGAKFKNCKFIGTRFIDCNFRSAIFEYCKFDYSDFIGTRIDTEQILKNLPDQPNVSREFLQIMRKNSLSMGDVRSSRKFVIAEINAQKEHLRRANRREEAYYKRKYAGFWPQAKIRWQRFGWGIDSFFWGHGERIWKMIVPIAMLLLIASFISIYFYGQNNGDSISSFYQQFNQYLLYYINLFIDVSNDSVPRRVIWIEWCVVSFRYLTTGVLISALFRWLSHR